MATTTQGYVYLLREREFVNNGQEVCKVGRTKNIVKRFSKYPKGSVLLFSIFCIDMFDAEAAAIDMLASNFKPRKDIGSESFEGDTKAMLIALTSFLLNRMFTGPPIIITPETCATPVVVPLEGGSIDSVTRGCTDSVLACEIVPILVVEAPPPTPAKEEVNKTMAISRFIDSIGPRDGLIIPSLKLYGSYLDYIKAQDTWTAATFDHNQFSKTIIHNYNASTEVVRFDEGPQRCIVFPAPPLPTTNEHEALKEWLEEKVVITGNKSDYITLPALKDVYKDNFEGKPKPLDTKLFPATARAYFESKRGDVVYIGNGRLEGNRHGRGIVRGVRMV